MIGMAACASDGVTAPQYQAPKYEEISGTYNGAMVGLAQGVAMNSTFSLTINQSGATTSGSWGLSGVLSDGASSLQIVGTGSLSGSVTQGTNPSVNLTFKSSVCPNYTASFSGSYDSANRRITISGPVDIFAANSCNVALRYNSTIILTR
jgi:hypothetical protein